MDMEGRKLASCGICYKTTESSFEVKKEISNFPGSEGCSTLNGHLRSYFVVRKLLKLPEEQIFQWISKGGNNGKSGGYLSPSCGEFCGRCEIIVDEAIGLHRKILEMERHMEVLGGKLMKFRNENGDVVDRDPEHSTDIGQKFLKAFFTDSSTILTKTKIPPASEKGKRRTRKPIRYGDEFNQSPGFIAPDATDMVINTTSSSSLNTTEIKRRRRKSSSTRKTVRSDDDSDSEYVPDESVEAEVSDEDHMEADDNYDKDFDFEDEPPVENQEVEAEPETKQVETKRDLETVLKSKNPDSNGSSLTSLPAFRFQCTDCTRIFASRSCLHQHTKKVHGFETLYPCPQCPDLKFSRTGLREHRKKEHDKDTSCYKCGKHLSSQRTLNQHFRLVHKMKITFPCSLCGKTFRKKSELTCHKNKDHVIPATILNNLPTRAPETEEERILAENPCEFCGKIFLSGKTFINHLNAHFYKMREDEKSKYKRIKCFYCWKAFRLPQSRWAHARMNHRDTPLQFSCEMCTEEKLTFPSTSELQTHYEIVHQKGDVVIHECVECSWPFMKEESINAHKEVHIQRLSGINQEDSEGPDYVVPDDTELIIQNNGTVSTSQVTEERSSRRNIRKTAKSDDDGKDSEYIPDRSDETEVSDEDDVTEADNNRDEDTPLLEDQRVEAESALEQNEPTGDLRTVIKSKIPATDGTSLTSLPIFRFQCTECTRVFATRSCLHHHTKKVHGFETLYPCPQCPDLKFSRTGLREHRKKEHDKDTSCYKCGKHLSCQRTLNQHFRLVHKMRVTFPCALCNKIFKKKSELRCHKKKKHVIPAIVLNNLPERAPETEEERILAKNPCDYCGKTFLSGKTFMNHLNAHFYKMCKEKKRKLKRINCFFCWKVFRLPQSRWVHTQMDHLDILVKFPCELCTEEKSTFPSISELQTHYESVHQKGDVVIHKCVKCGWPFMKEESLNVHKEAHSMRVPLNPEYPEPAKSHYTFKCWFCWEIFPSEGDLEKHLSKSRRHAKLKVEFPCEVDDCAHHTQPFKKVADLNTHLVQCHVGNSDNPAMHQCPICSWGFVSKDLLTLHKLTHVPRRYSYYKCPGPECDRRFRRNRCLRDHYNTTHGSNLDIYKCEFCPLRFTSMGGTSKHTEAIHKDEIFSGASVSTAMPCDQCGKIFRSEKLVKSHQYQQHAPDAKMCRKCGIDFPSKYQLKVHQKKFHKRDEDHLCPHCGKICDDQNALKRHIVIHGEKKFECEKCDFKTWAFSILRVHCRKHEEKEKKGPPPPPKFPCHLCDKGYARKDTLDDHIRVCHTSETKRVWTCPKCGKRFKRKGYLDAHVGGKGCSERYGPDLY